MRHSSTPRSTAHDHSIFFIAEVAERWMDYDDQFLEPGSKYRDLLNTGQSRSRHRLQKMLGAEVDTMEPNDIVKRIKKLTGRGYLPKLFREAAKERPPSIGVLPDSVFEDDDEPETTEQK